LDRIIITGGNGFIGGHLVKKILSNKLSSIALITNTTNIHDNHFAQKRQDENPPLTFYTADIRDGKAISNIFLQENADTCIHLAAKISVADSIQNPDETMDINVKGTLNVLEACHNSGVNNFVFASSAAVYGDVKELPISENQSLRPLSPYGTSKMLAEQHVLSYKELKKIKNTISLRIFNVYGSGQASEADVITRFAKRLSIGQPPVIHGDGMQTRDFISVDDVVDALILSTRAMEDVENKVTVLPSIFNVGTGTPTSISQLAQKMIEIFGLDLQPIYEDGKKDERGILHSYADITLAKKNLHFVPKTGIERGLREIIEPIILRKNFH
jgi:UDP-glucose 4-epimerase